MAAELLEIGVMFTALAVVGAVAVRVRQSVIPFYILVGMATGPFVAGRLSERFLDREYAIGTAPEVEAFVDLGAEIGIVFLLFFLGLEFNLDRLLQQRKLIGTVGIADLVVNFSAGFLFGLAVFRDPFVGFVVGGMVYISSSAIITKSLIDLGWIANDESSPILGTLVFEDLVIAVYLAVLSTLLVAGGSLRTAVTSIGLGMAFLVGLLLVVQYGTPFFEALVANDSSEFRILRVVGITLLVAGVALLIDVSEAVAAFFVGMAFSGTSAVEELETLLEPLRDVFAAVFFFWIGLVTDPLLVAGVAGLVLVAVAVTTPTKLASGFWSGKVYGLSDDRATRVGIALATRGEFTLIIGSLILVATRADVTAPIAVDVAEDLSAFAVGYVLAMSVIGTTLMQYSGVLEERVRFVRGS